jgi:hypothetical protein
MICYLAINCLGPVHTRTATPNQALAPTSWSLSLLVPDHYYPRRLLPLVS